MKRTILLSLCLALVLSLFGCATGMMQANKNLNDSNAELIEKAARDAAAQIITIPALRTDKKYIVMSSEQADANDKALNALIEDAVISALANGGFPVYERDKDVLLRMAYQEGSDKMTAFTLPPAEGSEQKVSSELPKYDVNYDKKIQIVTSKANENFGSQNIETADFIISYRVLEAGVRYLKNEFKDDEGMTQVKRKALVKLSVRLVDAKSGKIVRGETLSGMEEDLAPKRYLKYIEKSDYSFYPYSLPLQNCKTKKVEEKQETEK